MGTLPEPANSLPGQPEPVRSRVAVRYGKMGMDVHFAYRSPVDTTYKPKIKL
jgi:hypothetical protein